MKPAVVLALLASALSVSATSSQIRLTDDNDLKVPGDNPLSYCEDPKDYILDIDNVDIDPNPPQAGKNLTITARGTLNKEIEQGTIAYVLVKWKVVKILEQKFSLCDEAGNVDLSCPLDGEVELTKVVTLPNEIPPATYDVLANVTTEDDDIVTCLKASVPFKLPGSVGSMFGSDDL